MMTSKKIYMNVLKDILVEIRITSYIKNLVLFFPLFFSKNISDTKLLKVNVLAFLSFCCISSVIYIINDIFDINEDRQHPRKKHRPIASGSISIKLGLIIALLLFIISIGLGILINNSFLLLLSIYACITILYSVKLKQIAIIDAFIISGGFLLRVYAGSVSIGVYISGWLILTVLFATLFLGFAKRFTEKKQVKRSNNQNSRIVLDSYTLDFLRNAIWTMSSLTILFYTLWIIHISDASTVSPLLLSSIVLVIFGFLEYINALEMGAEGDPTIMLYSNRRLQITVILYLIEIYFILYYN